MESLQLWQVILLSLWAFLCINELLFTYLGLWQRPLIAGVGAGIILGDLTTGIVIGATLEMVSLGVHSYGGAVVPDYTTGSILGVVFGYLTNDISLGTTIGIPIALLGAYLDVMARMSTAICAHKGDKHAASGNIAGMWRWHLFGSVPWGLSRAIPVFIGGYFGDAVARQFIEHVPQWLMNGLTAVGHAMPALGIAILLNYLPFNKKAYFAVLGFVLVAYLKLPMIAVGILAAIVAIVYTQLYMRENTNSKESEEQIGGEF
ncbi:PTS sugar transporter [Citrobacter sp. NCU1]|uniref:PTS mannose/fructose/sorbose/N-acetylgalactosamine transporter subunit IIC n=1 Tax=Citrobacter sp. NCU1 TaxID=2026683 RepID=UPI001391862F|nr:PTS sugar transporter subunit IIC [Citrobacter sp. NCU1]NDO79770.1 PTS sugar transporter [Citrobacter sp. NCU1]